MSNKLIRVVHFCEKWGTGGIESLTMNIFRNIDTSKVTFDILLSQSKGNDYDEEIRSLGGTKRALLSNKTSSPMLRVLKNYIAFYKDVRKNKYQIIHFNACNGSVFICVFIAKLAGVPVRIIHSHNTAVGKSSRKLKVAFHNMCKVVFGGTATHYFACSDNAARWLFTNRIIKKKGYILSKNGINAEKFRFDENGRNEIREKLNIQDKFVVGHIGRFGEQKNHKFLIDIFNEIYKRNKDSVLILIGVGDLKEKIIEKVDRLGLSEVVKFIGFTEEIPKYMSAMDVFLFPSLFEGLGIVAVEAQAASLMTIASTEVPKEAKATDYLVYVDLEQSAEEWADIVLKYNNGYERKDMCNEIIESGFDIKTVAKKLESFYISKSMGRK